MSALQLTVEQREGLSVLRIQFGDVASPDDRDRLLVDGTREVISTLVSTTATATSGVALDIRTPDDAAPSVADAHRAAFIEACHGLVHSYVAEERTAIVPVNVVVSSEQQTADRDTTLGYLASPTATFARGAFFDLRDSA